MSRRPISTRIARVDLAQDRGVPNARMWSESPINQHWSRVASVGEQSDNSSPCTIYPVPEPVNTVFIDFVQVPSNWNIVYFQVDAAPSEVWVTFTYLETYFFYAKAAFDALADEWYVYVDTLGGTSANVYLNDAESFGEQLNVSNYVRVCPTDPPAGIE